MITPALIAQFARLVGREEFRRCLSLGSAPDPASLTADQMACLRRLIDQRLDVLARSLLEEAVSSDDVQDTQAVLGYLRERLVFLSPLLTTEQQEAVRQACHQLVAAWSQ